MTIHTVGSIWRKDAKKGVIMTNKIDEILFKYMTIMLPTQGDIDKARTELLAHFKSYLKSLLPKRKDRYRDYPSTLGGGYECAGYNQAIDDIERNIDKELK